MAPLALAGAVAGGTGMIAGVGSGMLGAMTGAGIGSMAGGLLSGPARANAPQARSYLGEMTSALDAQQQIQPRLQQMDALATQQWQANQQQDLKVGRHFLQLWSKNAH